jgi:GMP synthase (glutamine-hydrolysing)
MLIIKLGSAPVHIANANGGDFEHWIARGAGFSLEETTVVDPRLGETLPEAGAFSKIVISGSSSMVTECLDWSERVAAWLSGAVDAGASVLGICYGHQLLAKALGGRVGRNPLGREIGTTQLSFYQSAQDDPLFSPFYRGQGYPVQVSHSETVLELPPDAQLLASSELDPHQSFSLAGRIWGVQFHPEFNASISRGYLAHFAPDLAAEGLHYEILESRIIDDDIGDNILRRFAEL